MESLEFMIFRPFVFVPCGPPMKDCLENSRKPVAEISSRFLVSFHTIDKITGIFSYVPYVSPILGQLLNLMSLPKITLFGPKFKSYDPYDIAK